jgi:hypothetical protein
VEGGFANRAMLLPFEGIRRPPERDVPEEADEPPEALVAELRKLAPRPKPTDLSKALADIGKGDEPAPPVPKSEREKVCWGSDGAKAAYFEFSREIDQWEDKDKRKFELGMRATENAVRCATNVAAGCFSRTVDVRDIEWALRWSRVSLDAVEGGVKKYMREYYEFPKFCERVFEFIQAQGGFGSDRELRRSFRRNMKYGNELEKACVQLEREGLIKRGCRTGERGPVAEGWRVV